MGDTSNPIIHRVKQIDVSKVYGDGDVNMTFHAF